MANPAIRNTTPDTTSSPWEAQAQAHRASPRPEYGDPKHRRRKPRIHFADYGVALWWLGVGMGMGRELGLGLVELELELELEL